MGSYVITTVEQEINLFTASSDKLRERGKKREKEHNNVFRCRSEQLPGNRNMSFLIFSRLAHILLSVAVVNFIEPPCKRNLQCGCQIEKIVHCIFSHLCSAVKFAHKVTIPENMLSNQNPPSLVKSWFIDWLKADVGLHEEENYKCLLLQRIRSMMYPIV